MKPQRTRIVPREDAVQHERVDVKVQIEGPTEPLDHRHRAPTTVLDVVVSK